MTKPLTVLVVEDCDADYRLLERYFHRRVDWAVERATDDAQVIRRLRDGVDVILCDCRSAGIDVKADIEAIGRFDPDLPVILVSGSIGEEQAVELLRAGARDFVLKSNLSRLLPAIEREVKQAALRRERRTAQVALQDSESRFRQLTEETRVIPWERDAQSGAYLYVGPQAKDILGYPPKQWQDVGFWADKILPEDRQRTLDRDRENALQADNYKLQYRIRSASGRILWVHDMVHVQRDQEGQVRLLQGFMIDVSELEQTRHELQQREKILDAVSTSANRLLGATDWGQVADAVLANIGETARVSHAYIYENRRDQGELTARRRFLWCPPGTRSAMSLPDLNYSAMSLQDWTVAMESGNTVTASATDSSMSGSEVLQAHGILSLLMVPIFVNGRWWGLLAFDDNERDRSWLTGETDVLRTAADSIGAAIARQRSDEHLRQAASVFENTNEAIMITNGRREIIAVNSAFTRITGYEEKEVLGRSASLLYSGKDQDVFYQDIWNDVSAYGHWKGEVWNRRKNGELFPQWLSVSKVEGKAEESVQYAAVFSDISIIKQSRERLDYLAHHDSLTGLANRRLFNARLEEALVRAKRGKHRIAVIFLDLDRFKNVNDSLGHPAGDTLLKLIAERLKQVVRSVDTVARLGGDEFIVLSERVRSKDDVARLAARLLEIIRQPCSLEEQTLRQSASIGISLYPDNGDDVASLVKGADAAMYQAKELRRNTFFFYTSDLTATAYQRLELENQLQQGLEQGEMVLFYQLQRSLDTGAVTGAEALLRWQRTDGELLAPAHFLPLAEETGLIVLIDDWVIATACRQIRRWLDEHCVCPRVAVNVSGLRIQKGGLVEVVRNALKANDISPRYLELELSEGLVIQQTGEVLHELESLRQLGVTLAIDDFGTGYSSLNSIKRLPINKLKIDQTFVHDIPDDSNDVAIARAVIAMGHSLQLEVVAEGVEAQEQLDFLKAEGCDHAQGYLVARPVPTRVFRESLNCPA